MAALESLDVVPPSELAPAEPVDDECDNDDHDDDKAIWLSDPPVAVLEAWEDPDDEPVVEAEVEVVMSLVASPETVLHPITLIVAGHR